MKYALLVAAIAYTFAAEAVTKTPKTMVFKPKDKPEIIVKFDKPLPLVEEERPNKENDNQYTENCDIKYYNAIDRGPRVNGHRFMYNDNVKVYIGDNQYWVTPAFGAGYSTAFESKWSYCTTLVYENSADCRKGKNALRILIGVYKRDEPVYTNAIDFKIGWERDTDTAYLISEKGERFYHVGTVTEWH